MRARLVGGGRASPGVAAEGGARSGLSFSGVPPPPAPRDGCACAAQPPLARPPPPPPLPRPADRAAERGGMRALSRATRARRAQPREARGGVAYRARPSSTKRECDRHARSLALARAHSGPPLPHRPRRTSSSASAGQLASLRGRKKQGIGASPCYHTCPVTSRRPGPCLRTRLEARALVVTALTTPHASTASGDGKKRMRSSHSLSSRTHTHTHTDLPRFSSSLVLPRAATLRPRGVKRVVRDLRRP
jgi:hypothetical protein